MPSKISLNRTNIRKKGTTSRLPHRYDPPHTNKNPVIFNPQPKRLPLKKQEESESFCECFKGKEE